MDLPEELFVRAVPGTEDILAFTFPFVLEGKAAGDATVEELEDGDLIIEGYAAEFDGIDRQGENFIDGAFQRGIKSFLGGSAALCFHHRGADVMGKVLALEEHPSRGLWMRARVDGATKTHPTLGTIYSQVKKGTLTGLSVGGFFKRKMTEAGQRISDMDFTEISITGVPIHAKPSFAVVAGKALDSVLPAADDTPDYSGLAELLNALNTTFDALEGKAAKGDSTDLWFLATLLNLEQMTNQMDSGAQMNEGLPESMDKSDQRVDALAKRVKNYLDKVSREAHALAAELGPLPKIPTAY